MAEYIERETALKNLECCFIRKPKQDDIIGVTLELARKKVSEIPAADVEPVRHERWVYGGCSHCGSPWLCNDIGEPVFSPYCPGCGAKMDETT